MARHRPHSSDRRGHWLCIAYAFPPINRSGTHRTLGFVRHLDRLGWDATVLTVDPKGESTDSNLDDLVPESTRVVRTGWADLIATLKRWLPGVQTDASSAAPATTSESRVTRRRPRSRLKRLRHVVREWGSRLLVTPDSRIGWIIPGVRAALKTIRHRRPDVIYSTSPYMSAHLIAMIASVLTHIPWVADFRDPWRDNPFRKLGFRSLDTWDAVLEWLVLKRASHVICNTPSMRQALIKRRPFVAGKSATILNGFDPLRITATAPPKPRGAFTLLHCGQFYGLRSPGSWLAALRLAIELDPVATESLRVEFVGSEDYDGTPLAVLAEAEGVADRVRITGPCAHAQAITRMRSADMMILAGSSGASVDLQIPNKLYEYLSLRKPIIATAGPNSPILPILVEAKARALICVPDDTTAMARAMIHAVRRDANRPGGVREVWGDWSGVDLYRRRHRAEALSQIFHKLTGLAAITPPHVVHTSEATATDLRSIPQGEFQAPALLTHSR